MRQAGIVKKIYLILSHLIMPYLFSHKSLTLLAALPPLYVFLTFFDIHVCVHIYIFKHVLTLSFSLIRAQHVAR